MALPFVLLFLNVLNFIVAMVVLNYFFSSRGLAPVRWMLLLVSSFCVISFCTLGTYISRDFETQILFSRMRFLGLGPLASIWFLFVLSLYGRWEWGKSRWFSGVIVAPGIVTVLLTLVPAGRDFIIRDFQAITVSGFSVLQYSTGAWFPVHYAWSMFMVGASVLCGIFFFFKERGARRAQIVLLIASSLLAAGVDIYCVLSGSPLRWLLLASGTFLFSQIGIIVAALKLGLLDIVPLAMSRVFNEFPDPVIVVDANDRIRAVNRVAVSLFSLQEPLGRPFHQAFPGVDLARDEIETMDTSGERLFFTPDLEILATFSGEPSGRIVFLRNITVQKKIENRLNENLEFKARLLSMVAHDLSGFLQAQSYLSSHLDREAGPELKPQTRILVDSLFASKDMVANILPWVRTQENQFRPIVRSFDMGVLLKELVNNLESLSLIHEVRIHLALTRQPLIIDGDSVMIESVVRNLLTNAIRASSSGQSVEIFLEEVTDRAGITAVQVRIRDFGSGMSARQLEFARSPSPGLLDGSAARPLGFGLGLSIARRFVDLHHGRLEFASEEGRGTSVTLTLPPREPGREFRA